MDEELIEENEVVETTEPIEQLEEVADDVENAADAEDKGDAENAEGAEGGEGGEGGEDADEREGEELVNAENGETEGDLVQRDETAQDEDGEPRDIPAETDLDGELLEPNEEQKLQEDGTGEEEEQLDDVGEETQESGDLDESEQALLKSEDKEEGGLDTTGQDNLDETLENKENKEGVTMPVKKEVKRKAREKRYDENLILEEDDEEQTGNKAASPGPPQMEPIGQNLDESDRLNLNIHGDFNRDALAATTPDLGNDQEGADEGEGEPIETREEIIERYKAAVEERDKLQNINNQLHHKLADYYRKRKSEEAHNQPLFDKASQEQEQRYLKYLATIEGLRRQLERERWEAEKEAEELKEKCEMKQAWVTEDRMKITKAKKEAAAASVYASTGKAPQNKEIEAHLAREAAKELEVIAVRLENIKLKNQLKKKEQELKAKEELGEGLHMIDFEQLKIENQTYNEKIEERNEELAKLKKKINNTVQILTHVKEKLQFVFVENGKEKINLAVFDEQVKKNRDILNRIKQSRDALRIDNSRLKQNNGLLGNTVLLRDFEECVDQNDNLEAQIEYLKRRHAELVLNSKGVKQKISQTKAN